MTIRFNTNLLFIIGLAVALRLSLRLSSYYGEIAKRVEVSTPVTAWKRVVEGVTLKELNISAYSGDTFHESPVFLLFYQLLVNNLGDLQIFIVFILFDIVTAFLISKICADQLRCMSVVEKRRISGDEEFDEKDVRSLMIQANTIDQLAFWSLAIYCLSPYSILACVGQSTSIFINFLLALTIFLATHGQRFISLTLLSLLTLNSFYPLILLLPLIMILEQKFQINRKEATFTIDFQSRPTKISIGFSFILFIFLYSSWFSLSLFLEDWSFQFVHSIYVFMWSVSDLTPNIGLFWYFFTEMFDHFRTFFLCIFQINYFIYSIPLCVNLWRNPYFFTMLSLIIHSVFKPYPTVSDFALCLALFPQWSHLFENMKSLLVISCTIVTTTVLAPILWYLWIVLGTANSNFYFGITLAYNVAQIFLITDLMFSFVKREFYINNLKLYSLCKKTGKDLKIELSYK